ncbi:hypothetical protein FALBO_2113 [Fusarium albosuccineum]|uniref:Heterokaryon incompatibility domain-containing protein n=1 Tax=Fusarium albosuccineum TaxID=1237068 RepID=A0A8H4PLP7_9HYPO|nr:hypothetical protein FALBO_2113 [Fusarium albosuccineum]
MGSRMEWFGYPGVNRRLRYPFQGQDRYPNTHPDYPIGFPEYSLGSSAVLPLRETAMMMLMDKLTDKPNWNQKVFDEVIVQKWRDEALQQDEHGLYTRIMQTKDCDKIPMPTSRIISERAFDFCIAELRNKATYFSSSGLIPTYDGPENSIVKSDSYIGDALRAKLIKSFHILRLDQAANVDWHPGSNGMVQNLVHPSMYPFVYDRTRFIQEELVGVSNAIKLIGRGAPVPKDQNPTTKGHASNFQYGVGSGNVAPDFWSNTYQWLPANLAFRIDGGVKFTSYVNNLHPNEFSEVYKALESLIDKAIPAWDQCECFGSYQHRDSDDSLWSPEFDVETFKNAHVHLEFDELLDLDEAAECDDEDYVEIDFEEQEQRRAQGLPPLTPNITDETLARVKWEKIREAVLPEPKAFETIDYAPKQSIRERFRERGLQVIVKMASIELTPEKPEFPAGGWHLEGQMNEKICATALYYLDSDNVTSSHLAFRMQTTPYFNDDVSAGQDEYNYLERVYGTSLGPANGSAGSCIQNFGDVETRQGRLLAFPNVFQHRVSSFRLQDPTKPGYRHFIAIWLVDPHRRIISTANVPPQQKNWWPDSETDSTPERLMEVEEAQEHRLKLMDERSAHDEGDAWEDVQYSFCEQLIREPRPHYQHKDNILAAADDGCRLCKLITKSPGFEHIESSGLLEAEWYLSPLQDEETQDGQTWFRLTIDAMGDEGDPTIDTDYDTSEIPEGCQDVDEKGNVRVPKSGAEVKGPGRPEFPPAWAFTLIPATDINYEPPPGTQHPRIWSLAKSWLDRCQQDHPLCRESRNPTFCPTRLVEIVDSKTVRVIESGITNPSGPYAAFSHCWGRAKTLKLLEENKGTLETSIEITELPQSYKEALDVASRFGIKYIWIDSLCIIQNNVDDWRAEAATMKDVYNNALLTIAASAAAENSEASFLQRDPLIIQHLRVTPEWDDVPDVPYLIASMDAYNEQVESSPLRRRSWVLQESFLSARTLSLSSSQLWWECREALFCEAWPNGVPDRIRVRGPEEIETNPQTSVYHDRWCRLVEKYTKCGLTVLSDKMVAIGGLAGYFQPRFQDDEYVAGLWLS